MPQSIDKRHARIGGKNAVRALARSAQRASTENNLRPFVHRQDDGVGTVEVATVAIAVVVELRNRADLQHRRASILGKNGVLVGLGGLNRFALRVSLLTVGGNVPV